MGPGVRRGDEAAVVIVDVLVRFRAHVNVNVNDPAFWSFVNVIDQRGDRLVF